MEKYALFIFQKSELRFFQHIKIVKFFIVVIYTCYLFKHVTRDGEWRIDLISGKSIFIFFFLQSKGMHEHNWSRLGVM